jgi:hypothetical protein
VSWDDAVLDVGSDHDRSGYKVVESPSLVVCQHGQYLRHKPQTSQSIATVVAEAAKYWRRARSATICRRWKSWSGASANFLTSLRMNRKKNTC